MDEKINELGAALAAELAARIQKYFTVQPTLTIEETARELGISIELVRQKCNDGELPHVKLGPRLYRIKPVDINAYIEKHYERAK
ncbi:MAG: helix-turn-helix domain-containing protein [Victivallaceae bacterium]|nr:helix-turn-helix domain-containing protein [Victivallaceae bacterium]